MNMQIMCRLYLLLICSFLWVSINSCYGSFFFDSNSTARPVYNCSSGQKLQNNTCIDIDECQTYGICDQGCKNTQGSYHCFCHLGYSLEYDNKNCTAYGIEPKVLFSTRTNISGYYIKSQEHFSLVDELDHVVDILPNGDYLYWSEVIKNKYSVIKRRNIYTPEKREAIVTGGLHRVTSLAVDWITGNIYFTDSGYFHLGVCHHKGTHCTVLIKTDKRELRSLVLVPTKGLMYYYEEHSINEIKMVGMDGKNMTTLTESNFSVMELALDYPNNRLYWLSKNRMIESIKLDGTDKRKILHLKTMSPISLAVFENKLYWSDFESRSIQSCDKFFGTNCKTLTSTRNDVAYRIHIEAIKSRVVNPCRWNSCSQLCLLNQNNSHTCACSMDKKLDADGHTCLDTKKVQHLLIIAGNTFINYYHELSRKPKVTTSTFPNNITEAVYDQLTGTILAIDQNTHYVIRYDPKNGNITNLISIKNMVVGGMAFDYIGNNVYLSNIERKTIEVHSLTTRERTIFYYDMTPLSIVTVPTIGMMYVLFEKFSSIKLYKIKMNGLGEIKTVCNINNYNKLTRSLWRYDSNSSTLFTNDDHISLEFMLDDRIKFVSTSISAAVSFDVTEDSIFWTERNSKLLYRKIKKTNNWTPKLDSKHLVLSMPVDKVENPLVIYLRGIVVHKKEGCLQNNGNCSHLCLPTSLQSYTCACPSRMVLSANNRTCTAHTACPRHQIKCSEHDICIKPEQWCNGHKDCPNGEDEGGDCKEIIICKENEFMCGDYTCINAEKRCDQLSDCADHSDEHDCSKCEEGEHRCRNGWCISHSLVCDGNNDCADHSDELHCDNHTCASNQFMCDNGKCIPENWKCDGEVDCLDGSDEHCQIKSECGPDYYECANGHCISSPLECNGFNDCGDNSDEKYCTRSYNCTEDEYACVNSHVCVPKKAICNGIQDCPRNDDENHCAYCVEDEFMCDNQKCISKYYVCDKADDCGDQSDEKDCDNDKKKYCKQFDCINVCLSFDKVCDGIRNCWDGSDEYGNCSKFCRHAKCTHHCDNRLHGPVCSCRSGYNLDIDGISCKDINECEQNICSQDCSNSEGSYKCHCANDYFLRADNLSCKAIGPQMQYIATTGRDIRKISADVRTVQLLHELMGSSVSSIDSNARDDALYWSSEEEGTINKVNVKTKEMLTMDNLTPGAIAVDWITNNVYFSDSQQFDKNRSNMIKICNLKQLKCAVVVEIKNAKITALVVNPLLGHLFWSQTIWRKQKPIAEIYRTNLMGGNIKKIVFRNISVISGMAIDHIRLKLYWSDSYFKIIGSSNYDGSIRTTFLHTDNYKPAGINIFEDSIYWQIASTGQLRKCKLYGDHVCTTISLGANTFYKHFTIFQISRHPKPLANLCENQHCDYMCVLTHDPDAHNLPMRAACICQDGKPVESNIICPKSVNDEITTVASEMSSTNSTNTQQSVNDEITTVASEMSSMKSINTQYEDSIMKSTHTRYEYDSMKSTNTQHEDGIMKSIHTRDEYDSMKSTYIRYEGIYSTIIVVILIVTLVVGALSGSYYFYRKYGFRRYFRNLVNPNGSVKKKVIVHFRKSGNPKIKVAIMTSNNMCSEEYDYVNPIADDLSKVQLT